MLKQKELKRVILIEACIKRQFTIKQEYYVSMFKDSYNKQYKDLVCLDKISNLRKPNYVSHKFKEIIKKHDLPKIRFHDLKHGCSRKQRKNMYTWIQVQK